MESCLWSIASRPAAEHEGEDAQNENATRSDDFGNGWSALAGKNVVDEQHIVLYRPGAVVADQLVDLVGAEIDSGVVSPSLDVKKMDLMFEAAKDNRCRAT